MSNALPHEVRKPSSVHGRPLEFVRIVTAPRFWFKASSSASFNGAPTGIVTRRPLPPLALVWRRRIDYGILPWKKKTARAAIEKCMTAAFATLQKSSTIPSQVALAPGIESVARNLNDALGRLTLITVKKGEPCSDEEALHRQKASGFRIGSKMFIRREAWKPTDASKRLFIEHQILQTQRNDAATIDRKVIGVPGKPRYYVIDEDKLAAVIVAIADLSD